MNIVYRGDVKGEQHDALGRKYYTYVCTVSYHGDMILELKG